MIEHERTDRSGRSGAGRSSASTGASYGVTLLAWTLTLALIPMVIMAVQGYHCASQAVTESLVTDLRNVSEARATQIEDWVEDQRRELSYLARAAGMPPECSAGCACDGMSDPVARASQFLGTFLDSLAGYGGIAVVDAAGEIRDTRGSFPRPIEELVRAGNDGVVTPALRYGVVTPLYAEHSILETHLTVVEDEGRSAVGAVVASLDLSPALARILDRATGLGASGRAVVARADGEVIELANDPSIERSGASPDLSEQIAQGRAGGGVFTDAEGSRVVAGFAPVQGLGLSVIVLRDHADALHWLPRLARRALVVGLLTALAVILFSRLMSRRLSSPLRVLAGVARRISGGETVARVPELPGEEPGDVRAALNDMLDALQRSRQELSQTTALAAVGELSTSVVHELRNPLSSVKMNLQALAAKVSGDLVHAELADIATHQVGRIERMLDDLLSFGKPLSIEAKDATVQEILTSVEESVRGLAAEREVTVRFGSTLVGERLRTDPARAAQALENLVRNAIEASPAGEEVRTDASPSSDTEGALDFLVTDRGPGLPGGSRDRLFTPFFTCKPGGTGLGLANVKKVVELLGGSVDAYNREGGGAAFRMTLPDLAPGRRPIVCPSS